MTYNQWRKAIDAAIVRDTGCTIREAAECYTDRTPCRYLRSVGINAKSVRSALAAYRSRGVEYPFCALLTDAISALTSDETSAVESAIQAIRAA